MKAKISVNIDSELLNIIKDCSDLELDAIIQDALAQFFGIKQIWVRSDTLDPIPVTPIKIDRTLSGIVGKTSIKEPPTGEIHAEEPPTGEIHAEEPPIGEIHAEEPPIGETSINTISTVKNIQVIKKKRKPKLILKIWDKVKEELGTEFTANDYWDAIKKCGYDYKDNAKYGTTMSHLKLIEEAGCVVKINEKPKKYRKLEKGKESLELTVLEPKLLETGQPALKLFEDT